MTTTALRCRATGVTFAAGYPNNLADLARRCAIAGPVPVDLVRNLDNADDLNAISVRLEGRHLGWLPRDFAAFVAPQIDDGAAWRATAVYVAVDEQHRERPGLALELTREDGR